MKLKDNFINFIKGVIIGISNILPVSGSALAISFGVYEPIIESLGKLKKKNFYIILPIIIGIVVGVLSSSRLVKICLNKYYVQTMMFFIGLILGGIKLFSRKLKGKMNKKNVFIALAVLIVMVLFNIFIPKIDVSAIEEITTYNIAELFIIGYACAFVMLIPGASISFMLLNLDHYKEIIGLISMTLAFNSTQPILLLLPFLFGVILGFISIAKLIYALFKKHETKTNFAILGLIVASLISIIINLNIKEISLLSIISYFIFLSWGYLLVINLEKE